MPPRLPPRPLSPSSPHSMSESAQPTSLPQEDVHRLSPHSLERHPYSQHPGLRDPRSSSTQSLRPTEDQGSHRRTLLIVYIHGFLGDETSFRSFPAHVHSLLSINLANTHVIHSKIYPRYQSRKNVSFARDAFSHWLSAHESATTDIVLIGHSLGGIVGAEVVLMPSQTSGSRDAFQHRILGLIAFDTPFLGMHPGVVSTGIASLFRGTPDHSVQLNDASVQPWKPLDTTAEDPNFNPAFTNDINRPVRTNKWERAWYFWNKHCGELGKATQSYVKSHLEFGGCLADYPGLRKRYDAIRSLEDVDDTKKPQHKMGGDIHRVRFVNYYTASTGRIKERKNPPTDEPLTAMGEMQMLPPQSNEVQHRPSNASSTPYLSLEEYEEDRVIDKTERLRIDGVPYDAEPLRSIEPLPEQDWKETVSAVSTPRHDDLPPIPPEPVAPTPLETSQYSDVEALKLAKKENSRQMKAYERAVKDRQRMIKDRNKVIAKREQQSKKERDKLAKSTELKSEPLENDTSESTSVDTQQRSQEVGDDVKQRSSISVEEKKERRFCVLPSKDSQGRRDSAWIRVYMEGMDEVVAHTSLFFVSDVYAKLVGDTATRIEDWVKEDASTRMLSSQLAN